MIGLENMVGLELIEMKRNEKILCLRTKDELKIFPRNGMRLRSYSHSLDLLVRFGSPPDRTGRKPKWTNEHLNISMPILMDSFLSWSFLASRSVFSGCSFLFLRWKETNQTCLPARQGKINPDSYRDECFLPRALAWLAEFSGQRTYYFIPMFLSREGLWGGKMACFATAWVALKGRTECRGKIC